MAVKFDTDAPENQQDNNVGNGIHIDRPNQQKHSSQRSFSAIQSILDLNRSISTDLPNEVKEYYEILCDQLKKFHDGLVSDLQVKVINNPYAQQMYFLYSPKYKIATLYIYSPFTAQMATSDFRNQDQNQDIKTKSCVVNEIRDREKSPEGSLNDILNDPTYTVRYIIMAPEDYKTDFMLGQIIKFIAPATDKMGKFNILSSSGDNLIVKRIMAEQPTLSSTDGNFVGSGNHFRSFFPHENAIAHTMSVEVFRKASQYNSGEEPILKVLVDFDLFPGYEKDRYGQPTEMKYFPVMTIRDIISIYEDPFFMLLGIGMAHRELISYSRTGWAELFLSAKPEYDLGWFVTPANHAPGSKLGAFVDNKGKPNHELIQQFISESVSKSSYVKVAYVPGHSQNHWLKILTSENGVEQINRALQNLTGSSDYNLPPGEVIKESLVPESFQSDRINFLKAIANNYPGPETKHALCDNLQSPNHRFQWIKDNLPFVANNGGFDYYKEIHSISGKAMEQIASIFQRSNLSIEAVSPPGVTRQMFGEVNFGTAIGAEVQGINYRSGNNMANLYTTERF